MGRGNITGLPNNDVSKNFEATVKKKSALGEISNTCRMRFLSHAHISVSSYIVSVETHLDLVIKIIIWNVKPISVC